MIKAIITDFSKVLLFRKDDSKLGKLNIYHQELLKSGDYDFWKYFELNKRLLEFYRDLAKELEVYMFTSGYIQEYPPIQEKLKPVFLRIFSASRLGIEKDDVKAYEQLSRLLNHQPLEILFIDDNQNNLEAAKLADFNTVRFLSTDQVIADIKSVL